MDAEKGKAAMIKEARREVLAILNIMYQIGPFAFASICEGLTHLELPDEECVKKDLTYLCDKGLVEWTNKGDFTPWKKRLFKLTPRGNEIANAIERDPALEP